MRWFFAWTAALPVKLLLFAWLLYAAVVAALGALVKIGAAAKVSIAVLGVLATALVFPLLLGLIVGAVAAYAAPLFVVPRLWRKQRGRGVNFGLTVGVVVSTALGGLVLNGVAVRGIVWIADREPCAAFRAGVTGSVRPSDECLRGSHSSRRPETAALLAATIYHRPPASE